MLIVCFNRNVLLDTPQKKSGRDFFDFPALYTLSITPDGHGCRLSCVVNFTPLLTVTISICVFSVDKATGRVYYTGVRQPPWRRTHGSTAQTLLRTYDGLPF